MVLDLDLKDATSVDPDWSKTLAEIDVRPPPVLVLNTGNGFHVWIAVGDASVIHRLY